MIPEQGWLVLVIIVQVGSPALSERQVFHAWIAPEGTGVKAGKREGRVTHSRGKGGAAGIELIKIKEFNHGNLRAFKR